MKNCNCFKELKEGLKIKTGDALLSIDSLMMIRRRWEEVPAIMYHYHKKNKNGELCKKESSSPISFNFCPWCGKKYDYESQEVEK